MLFIKQEGGDRVPGWFDYGELYERAVREAPPGSVLVEVGVFCGKSLIHLGQCAKAANKGLTVVGVDTFAGSAEHRDGLSTLSAGALIHDAYTHLAEAGVLDAVTLVAAPSVRAAQLLAPSRPWFVFLDADHSEEAVRADIEAWATYLADGGILAGHDYHTFPGVKAAVDDIFPDAVTAQARSWWEWKSEVPTDPNRHKVAVCVFTYNGQLGEHVHTYCTKLSHQMAGHPNLDTLSFRVSHGYPTDRNRNEALKLAADDGFRYLLMLDNDMNPDMYLGVDAHARPFLPTALAFAADHAGPCSVGAPYCSAPPLQKVLVSQCVETVPDANPDWPIVAVRMYERHEAARMRGVQRCAALPTGCLLVDTRIVSVLPPPWFSYEFADKPFNTQLGSTEDTVFTRNSDLLGVPQYCAWDCWAGHDKAYMVGKPYESPMGDVIPESVWKAVEQGWKPKRFT